MKQKIIPSAPSRPDRSPASESPMPERTGTVSSLSFYRDAVWHFPTDTSGLGLVTLDWRIDPPDGSFVDHREWGVLLSRARRFIDSLLNDRRGGENLKVESLPNIFAHLLYLMRWMALADVPCFSRLTPARAGEFVEHLALEKGKQAQEPRQRATLAAYLNVLCLLYEQRDAMLLGRSERMQEHPFGGRPAYAMAGRIADRKGVKGWLMPVPDDVWLPVVTSALAWLEEPADMIVRLGETLAVVDGADPHLSSQDHEAEQAILARDGGRALIRWFVERAHARRIDFGYEGHLTNGVLRRLHRMFLLDLRDACTIVVQAMLGLRISEVAGLMAEPNAVSTGWPDCVRSRTSVSGLNEIFYVKGYVFKGKPKAEPTEWVAGTRPLGTTHLPAAVKALLVLDAAFRPWRRLGKKEELLVGLGDVRHSNDEFGDVADILSADLYLGQNRFMRRHVDLPAHRADYRLSTHQWRKSFSLYMVRTDERLLAAVSDHFKHLHLASTEQGYVGMDAGLLGLMHDEGVKTAAQMLLDACQKKTTLAGKMAQTIEDRAPHILRACGALGSDEQKLKSLTVALKEDGLRIWPSDWGRCLFRAEAARCHVEAEGKVDLTASAPNHGHRHPNVCCDCSNLIVADVHGPYWHQRHAENQAMTDACAKDGNPEGAAAATLRMHASKDILDKLQRRKHRVDLDDAHV